MSSVGARVFRACRVLLEPAKSSSSAAAATTKTTAGRAAKTAASKSKPKSPASPRRPSAILRPTPVSPVLGNFLGASEASRADAVKKIWDYIKSHGLQNPDNKKEIFCDEKLKTIFDGKDKVGFLEIGKLLSRHFVKTA